MIVKDIKPVKVNFNLRDHLKKDRGTAVHCVFVIITKKLLFQV